MFPLIDLSSHNSEIDVTCLLWYTVCAILLEQIAQLVLGGLAIVSLIIA